MTEPLYALKRDLDMLTDDVQNLKRSHTTLDYIAKVVHDVELEQLAQAAQMRRIEVRLNEVEIRLDKMEKHLDKLEERLYKIEVRLDKIENTLELIIKSLGIKR